MTSTAATKKESLVQFIESVNRKIDTNRNSRAACTRAHRLDGFQRSVVQHLALQGYCSCTYGIKNVTESRFAEDHMD